MKRMLWGMTGYGALIFGAYWYYKGYATFYEFELVLFASIICLLHYTRS